jgi:hypothetical protein
MFGIQETIARCYQYQTEFIGNMPKSVEYAVHVYTDSHRNIIRIYEHLYPEIMKISREAPTPSITVIKLEYS